MPWLYPIQDIYLEMYSLYILNKNTDKHVEHPTHKHPFSFLDRS